MNSLKASILTVTGVVGSYISIMFGGWTAAMTTLMFFMAIDYISGLFVAGLFKASKKSENGGLESNAGFKGLCKKGMTLLVVLVAARLDITLGLDYIKNAVVIAYIANETLSIIENAGLMGLPIPSVVMKAIDVLKAKTEEGV